jgi:hypothetical protein
MSKLVWDQTGERFYETGVKQGVLYPQGTGGTYPTGVAWNGLTAVTESPSGAEPTPIYADDIKYLNLLSAEEFGATIEAYTYPDEFKRCLGEHSIIPGVTIGQQKKSRFGLCYRTLVGNDKDRTDHGYKIHLIYDCLASSSEKEFNTVNDSPEAITFSWEISTNPTSVDGFKPTAFLVLDSTKFKSSGLVNVLRGIEEVLYGSSNTSARLPLISEIRDIWKNQAYLRDSNGEFILDSFGNPIQSTVYD